MSERSESGGRLKEQTAKQAWIQPVVTDLPKLNDLTLQTGSGIPGGGGTGGGGSTVIP